MGEDPLSGSADAPSSEVVEIIARARQLGFSPRRVAAALGLSAAQMAQLDMREPDASSRELTRER